MSPETVLLRQVHPSFIQNGVVTSQVFRPTPKDEGKLSAYDGDQIEPKASWQHYTSELNHQSAGVLGVSFAQCESLQIPVEPDPETFPEHVLLDFTTFDRKQTETAAKKLKGYALERGWLYQT